MSDHGSEDELEILDDIVVTKYKMAAEVTNTVLQVLIKMSVPGARIIELCHYGDKRIHEEANQLFKKEKSIKKGLAFPTSISVNNIICHYSPIEGEENEVTELHADDLVKIDLGTHIDGFAAVVGHTFVIGATQDSKVSGRKADVIQAANTAAEVALRLLRSPNENVKVSEMITKTAADYNCRPIEGVQSRQMRRMIYDAEKTIVLGAFDDHKKTVDKSTFEVNEVWDIDIVVSTGNGKPREHKARTTVFKKNDTPYQLKMKASRQLYSEITSKFLAYPFNIRDLDDLNKARLGITECVKHDVVQSLSVYCEKEDEFVAQFRFTVLLMPNGPMRITGLPFDSSVYKSEFKPRDCEIKEILLQPIKNAKKKKPSKAAVPEISEKVES